MKTQEIQIYNDINIYSCKILSNMAIVRRHACDNNVLL